MFSKEKKSDGLISPKTIIKKPKKKGPTPKVKIAGKDDIIERDEQKRTTEDGRELLI